MRRLVLQVIMLLLLTDAAHGATFYLSSVDGSDSDDGSTWALAKATLCGVTGALASATTTGDIIYVDSAHAESSGAAIACNVATSSIHVIIISVDRNGSSGTGHNGWLAGATVTVGLNNATLTLMSTTPGKMFIYGISFIGNNGSNTGNDVLVMSGDPGDGLVQELFCHTCTFSVPGTGTTAQLIFGALLTAQGEHRLQCYNCTAALHNNTAAAPILFRGWLNARFVNFATTYNTAEPATLIESVSGTSRFRGRLEIMDSDLSAYEAAGSYFNVSNFSGQILLRNVKLSPVATTTLSTGTWATNQGSLTIVNTDDTDTHNTFEFYNRLGSLTTNTSIYHDTGAKFNSANVSWQLASTASASASEPFCVPFTAKWSTTTSATVGLRFLRDNATGLTDNQVWAEIEYLDNASFPNGTLFSSRTATPFDDASPDTLASDSEEWTDGGMSNENKQKIETSLTPAEASLLRGRFCLGVASQTVYLDPLLRISTVSDRDVYWHDVGAIALLLDPTGGLFAPGGMMGLIP